MKIALLTKYGELAASTRQRFYQYRNYLQDAGFQLEYFPLLDDIYLQELYAGKRQEKWRIFSGYFARMRWLLSGPDVDAIWLNYELFPYLPGALERLVCRPGKPVIFDYDDAIFHNYDLHKNRLVRSVLGRKLETTIGSAILALCGNEYLADYARPLCSRVELVPTVVDADIYRPGRRQGLGNDTLRIGWIGTPSTWNEYMVPLMPLLSDVAQRNDARIMAVGTGTSGSESTILDIQAWSEDSEVDSIQHMDIGIMPLGDTPWARGKCGYKLIQYMACGLPVVASPVGVNAQIVEHGVNGFLATTEAEWRGALTALIRDAGLRERMGQSGRRKIEQHYSLQVWGPRVAALLQDVAGTGRTG